MKYIFELKKSQDGTPTLVVTTEDCTLLGVIGNKIVNVFTGKEAEDIYNKLIKEAKK